MPRDPSGNYTLPALGNPAVTNTPITIAWWNGTSTDFASTLTDSLSRSGLGGMLVPFKLVDGSPTAPAFAFQSESNTGFYRPTANEMDVVVGGTRLSRWNAANGFASSPDNGATWVFPVYGNVAGQSMGVNGALDFAAGKLTIASIPVIAGPSATTTASASTGNFTSSAAGPTAVTNANLSFTATGRPVLVQLVSDDNASLFSRITTFPVATGSSRDSILELALSADAGSTFFARQSFQGMSFWTGISYNGPTWGPSSYSAWYTPAAGAATIGLYVFSPTSTYVVGVFQCKLLISQF